MQLDNLAVAMRPRNPWEASDVGVLMARRWYWPMFWASVWLSLPFVIAVNLALLFFEDYLYAAPLFYWWSKPVWERIHLHILSQAVFGAVPDFKTTAKKFPALLRRQLLQALIWRRLSLSRSFNAPVAQLEGLSGSARRKRITVLRGESSEPVRWTTIVGVHVESFLYMALFLVLIFLIPAELSEGVFNGVAQLDPRILTVVNGLSYHLVMLLVMPFYVAAGFALYLNRRAELEGWDIEIAFRNLAERESARQPERDMAPGMVTAGLVLVMGWGALSPDALAQEAVAQQSIDGPGQSAQLMENILNGPEFHVEEQISVPDIDWEAAFDWNPEVNWFFRWLGNLFSSEREVDFSFIEVILWAAVALLVAILLARYGSWLREFAGRRPSRRRESGELPHFLQQLGPEVLPDDVPGAARELWQQGEQRAALALLYRASLQHLIDRYALPIHSGTTEGECIVLLHKQAANDSARYFTSLSLCWQRFAYGHIPVPGTEFEALAADWGGAMLASDASGDGECRR